MYKVDPRNLQDVQIDKKHTKTALDAKVRAKNAKDQRGTQEIAKGRTITVIGFIPHFISVVWTVLGIVVSLARIGKGFDDLVSGEDIVSNILTVTLATGAFSTCLAMFYKLDFLKLAWYQWYKPKWAWFIAWPFTCISIFFPIYISMKCASYGEFIFSMFCWAILTFIFPLAALFRYNESQKWLKASAEQQEWVKQAELLKIDLDYVNSKINIQSCYETCRVGLFDIVVLFFSCVSWTLGSVTIIVGFDQLYKKIFTEGNGWEYNAGEASSCSNQSYTYTDSNGEEVTFYNGDYLNVIVAGCFSCASAMGKIAGAGFRKRSFLFNALFICALIAPAVIVVAAVWLQFRQILGITLAMMLAMTITIVSLIEYKEKEEEKKNRENGSSNRISLSKGAAGNSSVQSIQMVEHISDHENRI